MVRMDAPVRVWLFGTPRTSGASMPLVSAQRLVALLCERPGAEWGRAELAQLLWPDASEEAIRSRLRTALVQARSVLGANAIAGDKQSLCLDPSGLEVDVWEAKALIRRANIADDPGKEEAALRQLLAVACRPYLAGQSGDWIEGAQRRWRQRTTDARFRLAEIAEAEERWGVAAELVEEILEDSPYDERAWLALLRLSSRRGTHVEVCARMDLASQKLRGMGARFSPGTLSLADSVRSGKLYPTSLPPLQGDMASRTLSRMLSDGPEDALLFLGSDAFRTEVYREPVVAADLLERTLATTLGHSESRLRCTLLALVAHSVLQNHGRARELATEVLEHDRNLARRRGAATMLAFAHFQVREWDLAYRYGEMAVDLAAQMKDQTGLHLARAQVTAFDWHQGRYEQALASYTAIQAELEPVAEQRARLGRAVIAMNAGYVHAILGDLDRARDSIEASIHLAALADHPSLLALALPALGALEVLLGGKETGAEMLARGLGIALRQKDERSLQIGLEWAAWALAALGDGASAQATMVLVGDMRAQSSHARSPFELRFAEIVSSAAGAAEPDPTWLLLRSRRRLASAMIDRLAEAAENRSVG